jgi:hypothetical protein
VTFSCSRVMATETKASIVKITYMSLEASLGNNRVISSTRHPVYSTVIGLVAVISHIFRQIPLSKVPLSVGIRDAATHSSIDSHPESASFGKNVNRTIVTFLALYPSYTK